MIIIAGSSNLKLAKQLSDFLGTKFIVPQISRFEDQELNVRISEDISNKEVFVVCSTSKPANDHLVELLLLIDVAGQAKAANIIAVLPYFGYSRQDKALEGDKPLAMNMVSRVIKAAGADRLISLDLHSPNEIIENIDSTEAFSPLFSLDKDYVIVSPDVGGINRAKKFSEILKFPLAIINKVRTSPGECSATHITGEVEGKHCIIIDDIIDTAGTLCLAVDLLKDNGALSVVACATHAVFSKNAIEKIQNSELEALYITDTIENNNLPDKIKTISVSKLLADKIL